MIGNQGLSDVKNKVKHISRNINIEKNIQRGSD